MASISLGTFQRLYVVAAVSLFSNGVYGLKRLHKVTYLSLRDTGTVRPFEFRKYHFGQHSETLDDTKDQLVSMGIIAAVPLATATILRLKLGGQVFKYLDGGNRFFLPNKELGLRYRGVLKTICPKALDQLRVAVKDFGYKSEPELVEYCYSLPELKQANFGDTLLSTNLPEQIKVPVLSEEDCENLELALNPNFVAAMLRIVHGMDRTTLDLDRIKKVGEIA